MPEFNLTLPIQTFSEANRREHWARKAKRAKAQRHATYIYLRNAFGLLPYLPTSKILVELTRVATRKLDDDNLRSAFKAIRDGIASKSVKTPSWLNIDDGTDQITWSYSQRCEPKSNKVELRIVINE